MGGLNKRGGPGERGINVTKPSVLPRLTCAFSAPPLTARRELGWAGQTAEVRVPQSWRMDARDQGAGLSPGVANSCLCAPPSLGSL